MILNKEHLADGSRVIKQSAKDVCYANSLLATEDNIRLNFLAGKKRLEEGTRSAWRQYLQIQALVDKDAVFITKITLHQDAEPRLTDIKKSFLEACYGTDQRWLFAKEFLSAKRISLVSELFNTLYQFTIDFGKYIRTFMYVCSYEGIF